MIFDLLHATPEPVSGVDVCIVGAGASGIALAVQLANRGKRVVLLEGGGAQLENAAQEPYRSTLSGLPHRGIHDGRFRGQGGTTTKWGGQILELDETDFNLRPWIADSGWPFAKQELQPYYNRALELEGLTGAIHCDKEVWSTLGFSEPHFEGVETYLSRWCPEPNFAHLHSRILSESTALQLWLHTNAVELLWQGDSVSGVRTRTQSGKVADFSALEYVFCLGAIESSRFFLQPCHSELPWNQSCQLGLSFQDHIDCNAATLLPTDLRALHHAFDSIFLGGYKYQPKFKLHPKDMQSQQLLNAAATLAFSCDEGDVLSEVRTTVKHVLRRHFSQIRFSDIWRVIRHTPAFAGQSYRFAAQRRGYQPPSAVISLRIHCEQEPHSNSRITLSRDRDSLGLFRADLRWEISSLELKTIRYALEIFRHALAPIACIEAATALEDDDSLRALCEDSFHHMGGMRMDSSPHKGVVDTNLKLHGVANAWVCSSAVFPTSGFSNPTHTLLALAERLSDHLCSRHN